MLSNTAQYELIKMLASKYKNLCVVGDDDQSIYGWRGANIYNILNFEADFKGTRVIKLEQNYRSTQTILKVANAVISNNPKRKDKNLWTQNQKGSQVIYNHVRNDFEEANFVASIIKDHIRSGGKYSDMAILYRQNSLSRLIEDQLVKNSIPYRLFGGVRFYDRREVKDILAYLKIICNFTDDIAIKRIINVPRRGIGAVSVDKISEHAFEREYSFFEALQDIDEIKGMGNRTKKLIEFSELINYLMAFAKDNTISALVQEILDKTEYIKEIKKEDVTQAQVRIENIQELVNKAVEFEKISEDKSLMAFLQDVSLVADIDSYEEGEDATVLMTLHSSKGLEFPTVFMVGVEESIFPSYRSIIAEKEDFNKTLMEEERRLCYVGVTRAKETLYITSAVGRMTHGRPVSNSPSRFLKEIPAELITTYTERRKTSKDEEKPFGLSQFAGIKIFGDSIDAKVRGKNYKPTIPVSQDVKLDFEIGDTVMQVRYGKGIVKAIAPAGADYEVTVEFEDVGVKKFMAHLSKLKKL